MKEILKQVFKVLAILAFVLLAIGAIFFLFVISELVDTW